MILASNVLASTNNWKNCQAKIKVQVTVWDSGLGSWGLRNRITLFVSIKLTNVIRWSMLLRKRKNCLQLLLELRGLPIWQVFLICKNRDNCRRLHLKEVCLILRGCDDRKCEKRHSNPCKTFMLKGFCRFGTACKYSNRISKETEEQNKKIESLEEIF